MRLSAWRITKREHAQSAFTGEGARLYGGRWNSPGVAMVYVAQSRALAALEMLVHLDSAALLKSYVIIEVAFEESQVKRVALNELPFNWMQDTIPASTQAIGKAWVSSGVSLALKVPSVLIPGESNFLLNPKHPDFSKLEIGEPLPFEFDPRLIGR